jgi:DNA-binding protein Fis
MPEYLSHPPEIKSDDELRPSLERWVEIINGEHTAQALQAATVMYHSWVNSQQADSQTIETFKSFLPKIIADYPAKKADQTLTFAPLAQEFIDDLSGEGTLNRSLQLQDGDVLEAFGCHYPIDVMRQSWRDGTKASHRKHDMAQALQVMSKLESMQPGIVDELQNTNYLRNFQRYDPAMLYEMYLDQIEHPDQDYVLAIQSVADHNNAFKAPELYKKLYARLKKMGLGLRIYECGNLSEFEAIADKVLEDHATFGARVAAELIAGHGTNKTIRLGTGMENSLHAAYLVDSDHRKIAEAFTRDAEVKLHSCSTGKETHGEPSIARELAIAMGRTVIAPTMNAYAEEKIRAIRKGDGVNLMMSYRRSKGKRNGRKHIIPTKPARYNGKTCERLTKTKRDPWDLSDEIPSDTPFIELTPINQNQL